MATLLLLILIVLITFTYLFFNFTKYIKNYIKTFLPTDDSVDVEVFEDDEDGFDPLFGLAAEAIIHADNPTASFLQRKFQIGYARAIRIVYQLEQKGILSTQKGSKARKILKKYN